MLMTIKQAASELNLSRQRVWLLVQQGRIKAQQVGPTWLIHDYDLDRFARLARTPGRPSKRLTLDHYAKLRL